MVSVVPKVFGGKQEAVDKEDTFVSSSHFPSSNFINLNDSSDEDVSLHVSFDMNVFGSFLALILDVYPIEDMLSNLNQV
jgi:hypothetical protein